MRGFVPLPGCLVAVALLLSISPARAQEGSDFVRGDANFDGTVSISDQATLSRFLFLGASGPVVGCRDAGDTDDNGHVEITDPIVIAAALFLGGPIFPEPFPLAGQDPTPDDNLCDGPEVTPPAEDDRFTIEIGTVSGEPGDEVTVPVFATTPVEVDALSLAFVFDPDEVEILDLSKSGTVYEDPEFFNLIPDVPGALDRGFWGPQARNRMFEIINETGDAILGIQHDLAGDVRLKPLDREVIVTIRARIKEGATGEVDLIPQNGISDPPVSNEFSVLGDAVYAATLPELIAGRIKLGVPTNIDVFLRGDSNGDNLVNEADAIHTLQYLFLSGPPPGCRDAADANDSGGLDIGDPIVTLLHRFRGSFPELPDPFGACGADPTDDDGLECESYSCTE